MRRQNRLDDAPFSTLYYQPPKQSIWTKERHFPTPLAVFIIAAFLFVNREPILSWYNSIRIQKSYSTTTPVSALLPTLATQHEVVPFPASGTTKITWDAEAIAGFEIHTENTNTYHYIKLENITDDTQKVFVYVHPQSVSTVEVPLGEYKLYMASGNTWYGEDLIFGSSGEYQKALDTLKFYEVEHENGSTIHGNVLTLKTVVGNLHSTSASINDFT